MPETYITVTIASSCVSPLCKFVGLAVSLCFIIYNIYFDFVMSASKVTKRKLEDEGRVLQEKWENMYVFSVVRDKIVCLICSKAV
jgi:hypothetical protein